MTAPFFYYKISLLLLYNSSVATFMATFLRGKIMKNKKSMMYLAISNLFLVFLGVGLVIPVIPALQKEMGFNATTMGMMISIFAIAQLVASPFAGMLSDKLGRKKLIVTGMLICHLRMSFWFSTIKKRFLLLSWIRWRCRSVINAICYSLRGRYDGPFRTSKSNGTCLCCH